MGKLVAKSNKNSFFLFTGLNVSYHIRHTIDNNNYFIKFKDCFDGRTQHTDTEINEKSELFTSHSFKWEKNRQAGPQRFAPRDRAIASRSFREQFVWQIESG